MTGDWIELNRAFWDERVPLHVASDFYAVDAFLAGESMLRPFEIEEMGDVNGMTLFHPQCHFGMDTLSWARQGARVTGLDFSEPAIEAARDIAARAGIDADFVVSNVYDAEEAVGGRTFDVVYTGLGAINWLPDINRWATTMAARVKPGGRFYLAEFHPVAGIFSDETLDVEWPYFGRVGMERDEGGSYVDMEAQTQANDTIETEHPLGNVVSALIDAGLEIRSLREHDYTLFQAWPFLERHDDRTYRMPEGSPDLPLMYSVLARRAS
jgi:SAM-dependent methyltransferase